MYWYVSVCMGVPGADFKFLLTAGTGAGCEGGAGGPKSSSSKSGGGGPSSSPGTGDGDRDWAPNTSISVIWRRLGPASAPATQRETRAG